MSAFLDRITDAQDVPDLLCLWSPVWLTGENEGYRSAVCCLDELATVGPDGAEPQTSVALDLTDATGRWHVVLWLYDQPISLLRAAADVGPVALGEVMDAARRGAPMTPEQIDILARLCLRLAGRTP